MPLLVIYLTICTKLEEFIDKNYYKMTRHKRGDIVR